MRSSRSDLRNLGCHFGWLVLLGAGCAAASGRDAGPPTEDAAMSDAGAPLDAALPSDAGHDAGAPLPDAGSDAGVDGGVDAGGGDAGFDAGVDGGFDAGLDGGFDAGFDGGFDAGFDGGSDAGPPGPPPPWTTALGAATFHDVAVDGLGRAYVVGSFEGTITVGADTLIAVGSEDALVLALDRDGAPRWARGFGGTGEEVALAVDVDAAGNLYVGGRFDSSINFGAGARVGVGVDGFVVSFDADATLRWDALVVSGGSDAVQGVRVDALGHVALVGHVGGAYTVSTCPSTGAGSHPALVASLDAGSGSCRWRQDIGVTSEDLFAVEVDGGGNVYFTGRSSASELDIGGGNRSRRGGPGANDMFVGSYSVDGAYRWGARYGGGIDTAGLALAVRGAELWVAGRFRQRIDLCDCGGVVASTGLDDGFLGVYALADGAPARSATFGTSGDDAAVGVAVDGGGDVFVVGYTGAAGTVGGATLPHAGMRDVLVASYTSALVHRWSETLGGADDDEARGGPALDGDQLIWVGSFAGSVDFGTGAVAGGSRAGVAVRRAQD